MQMGTVYNNLTTQFQRSHNIYDLEMLCVLSFFFLTPQTSCLQLSNVLTLNPSVKSLVCFYIMFLFSFYLHK